MSEATVAPAASPETPSTDRRPGVGVGVDRGGRPGLWEAMEAERRRQTDKIELIASENYVYEAVLEAQGSWLTNKYAEGLPGKRYYGGCEYVDVAENLARIAPSRCSPARTTSTSSPIRAPRPTWPPTSRC